VDTAHALQATHAASCGDQNLPTTVSFEASSRGEAYRAVSVAQIIAVWQ